jgi:hypothetical protein
VVGEDVDQRLHLGKFRHAAIVPRRAVWWL